MTNPFPITVDEVLSLINGSIDLYDGQENDPLPYFDVLYEHYFTEMPYGVQKARDGDPAEWIMNRLEEDFYDHIDKYAAQEWYDNNLYC